MSHKLEETFETLLGNPKPKEKNPKPKEKSKKSSEAASPELKSSGTASPSPSNGNGQKGLLAKIIPLPLPVSLPEQNGSDAGNFEPDPEKDDHCFVESNPTSSTAEGSSTAGSSAIEPQSQSSPEAIHCTGGTEISVEVEPLRDSAQADLDQVEIPCEPGDEIPSTSNDVDTGTSRVPNREEIAPQNADGFAVEHLDHRKIITYSKGSFLVPNYISDYLLKNLSLAEQSVFNRLYRISAGFHRRTDPLTISDLAESCGLNAKFTATVIKSLVSKKLVKVIWGNPLSRKVRFKLILPKEVEKRIVLCGVCHDLIHEEEEWEYYPVAQSVNGHVQTIVAHNRCIAGEPLS